MTFSLTLCGWYMSGFLATK